MLKKDQTGTTDAHVAAVLESPSNEVNEGIQSKALAAVLLYTDAMTLNVRVPEEVFEKLKACFSEQEIVEITATIAGYNCVSRFLVALDVGERNAQRGPMEGGKE
jgi:alkylhydroperoxidase family enzyme